ncbi:MAG: helix-turn-helix domain-containing protein [Acidobacteriota bacterium]
MDSASTDRVDDGESFGAWLRGQREMREIDLREIADSSKIGIRYLEALERGRFDVLPAPVFTKGFLRQYARYVGLDAEEVINYYLAARDADQPDDEAAAVEVARRRPRTSTRSNARVAILVLLLAVALLALVWLLSRVVAVSDEAPAPGGEPTVSVPAAGGGALDAPSRASTPTVELANGPGDAAEEAPEVEGLELILDFSGQCWVEATVDADDRLARTHIQGESLRLVAERSIELKVGDVGVVAATLNGQLLELASAAGGSAVRRLRVELPAAADGESAEPIVSFPGAGA